MSDPGPPPWAKSATLRRDAASWPAPETSSSAGRPRASSSSVSAALTAHPSRRLGEQRQLEADRGDERIRRSRSGARARCSRSRRRDDVRRARLDVEPTDGRDRLGNGGRFRTRPRSAAAQKRRSRSHRRRRRVRPRAQNDRSVREPGDAGNGRAVLPRSSTGPARCRLRGGPAAARGGRARAAAEAALLVPERNNASVRRACPCARSPRGREDATVERPPFHRVEMRAVRLPAPGSSPVRRPADCRRVGLDGGPAASNSRRRGRARAARRPR